jgi:hypothetical protein
MTSVNKIKELAAAHDYSVAVEILDSQDLEKSLNPQFLRVCGEVYENVGRYPEARALYVKAHKMAPESNRIVYALISFYLKVGYFSLADQYYQQYIFNAKQDAQEINNINYIMNKARGAELEELFELLYPYYMDHMDEDWSFELLLLAVQLGKEDVAEHLSADYKATYRDSDNCRRLKELNSSPEKAEGWFRIYADAVQEDDAPEDEAVRILEQKQLQEDYDRMNPKESEIIFFEDDDEELSKSARRKLNRLEKKKKKQDEHASEDGAETDGEEMSSSADQEDAAGLEETPEPEEPFAETVKQSLKDFIKKTF